MVEIDSLREHIFGDWENTPWPDIRPLVEQGVNPPNGETYPEFTRRIQDTIHMIHATDHDAPPLLVAHGGLFHAIGRMYNQKIGEVGNCALFHFSPALHQVKFPWVVTSFSPCQERILQANAFIPFEPK